MSQAFKLEDKDTIINYLKSNTTYIDDCWVYNNIRTEGYGGIKISGKSYSVHRVSAYLFLGMNLYDEKLQPNHKDICKSRACWNPDHLYIGTQFQNAQDTRRLGRYHNQKKTHCKRGHTLDGYTRGPSTNNRIYRYCKICRLSRKRKKGQ